MTKLFFSTQKCEGATSGATGNTYKPDKKGFFHVDNPADVACFTAENGGFVQAGGMPRLRKFYVCECGWEASIRHCPKCDRDDLTKVEK